MRAAWRLRSVRVLLAWWRAGRYVRAGGLGARTLHVAPLRMRRHEWEPASTRQLAAQVPQKVHSPCRAMMMLGRLLKCFLRLAACRVRAAAHLAFSQRSSTPSEGQAERGLLILQYRLRSTCGCARYRDVSIYIYSAYRRGIRASCLPSSSRRDDTYIYGVLYTPAIYIPPVVIYIYGYPHRCQRLSVYIHTACSMYILSYAMYIYI